VAPQPDVSWVKAFDDFDKSKPESATLQDYLAKFNSVFPSEPALHEEYFAELNDYFVKRYTDVFAESLPDRLPHPESPHHRIVLKNESVSLNGRNYRIPT
jgi:hypothetical protein